MELVLKSDPVFNTRFNTDLQPLDSMQEVDDEEADKMKLFLKSMNLGGSVAPSGIGLDSVQDADGNTVD